MITAERSARGGSARNCSRARPSFRAQTERGRERARGWCTHSVSQTVQVEAKRGGARPLGSRTHPRTPPPLPAQPRPQAGTHASTMPSFNGRACYGRSVQQISSYLNHIYHCAAWVGGPWAHLQGTACLAAHVAAGGPEPLTCSVALESRPSTWGQRHVPPEDLALVLQ